MTAPGEAEPARLSRLGIGVAGAACLSVIVSHIFGRTTYSLLLPAISDDLVSSYSAAGFLGVSYFVGYLIGVVAVTLVSARLDPTTLMRSGLALAVIALALMAVAPSFLVLAAGIFIVGLAGAAIWIPAPTVATLHIPEHRRGLVIGSLTAAMGVGLLLVSQGTNLYRNVAADSSIWRPIFGLEAAATVAIVAVFALVLRRSRAAHRPLSTAPSGHTSVRVAGGPMFSFDAVRSVPHWALLTTAYCTFALLAGSWTQFMGVAAADDAGFSDGHVANLFSLLAVSAMAGPIVLGALSDRIGRDRAMAIAAGLAAAASVLFTFNTEPWVGLAAVLYGAGSFGLPPLAAAAVRDHLDGGTFGTAFGTMTVLYALMSMLASQTAGIVADAAGSFRPVYLGLAVAAAVSAVTALSRARLVQGHQAGVPG